MSSGLFSDRKPRRPKLTPSGKICAVPAEAEEHFRARGDVCRFQCRVYVEPGRSEVCQKGEDAGVELEAPVFQIIGKFHIRLQI